MAAQRKQERLPPEVSRILYVRNLPYKIENDEMYDIFGKYGAIRQIRIGTVAGETKGTDSLLINIKFCFLLFQISDFEFLLID